MANLDLVIPIPKAKTKPAPTVSKGGFPPSLPSLKLPKLPAAITKVQTVITGLVPKIQKVIGVIQNAQSQAHAFAAAQTITLKVKRGGSTVFEKQVAPLSTIV